MGAILFGKCLYGSEWHYITGSQIFSTRRAMCMAMSDKEGRRPDSVGLLVIGAGKHGLGGGIHERVMHRFNRAHRSPVAKGMLWDIQSDNVYTPARARRKWGCDAGCPLCDATMGTWHHHIDEPTGTRRPRERNIAPPALRYFGVYRNAPGQDKVVRHVGTGGSCRTGPGGKRPRWGVYWGPYLPFTHATRGGRHREQMAAVRAMMDEDTAIYIITASMQVYNNGSHIILGRTPGGRHANLLAPGLTET